MTTYFQVVDGEYVEIEGSPPALDITTKSVTPAAAEMDITIKYSTTPMAQNRRPLDIPRTSSAPMVSYTHTSPVAEE